MNKLDLDYQNLLQDILDNGIEKKDRTGTGTLSVFGRQIRHKMSDGFPLLTTKKMAWKSIVTELLWFLRGDTNIKYLVDNDCHIWDGDAYKNYLKTYPDWYSEQHIIAHQKITQEEFINRIKTDDGFAKTWGELGPIYGKQWRNWGGRKVTNYDLKDVKGSDQSKVIKAITNGEDVTKYGVKIEYQNNLIDQIQNLINELKTNPDSRRLMVNAWNVGEISKMVLPPCHYGFQVYTRELSLEERATIWNNTHNPAGNIYTHNQYDENEIPARAISLMWNQRSVDTFLGLPFNIASYGLLLEIIAKMVNMIPDELIGNLGDVHLYSNHVEQAKEQIGRKLTVEERMDWWFKNNKPNRDVCDHVDELSSYAKGVYFDSVKVPKSTREPFELPTLKMNPIFLANLEHKGLDEAINGQVNFELENYQSHPTIKAKLSN